MFFSFCSPTSFLSFFFFFNDTATTEIYSLSLHDALPISTCCCASSAGSGDAMNRSLYAARRRRNGIMLSLSLAATLLGLGWLVVILSVLLWEGFSGLSLAVFTEMTPPPGADGGLLHPLLRRLILTGLAGLAGPPIGMLAGASVAAD